MKHALERAAHRLELRRVAFLIDLDVHVRLDDGVDLRFLGRFELDALRYRVAANAYDRMQQQMDVAPQSRDLGADGVDEERHVVVHDLDDGVLEAPAVGFDSGIEEAHFRRADLTDFAELPERERAAEEGLEGGIDNVVGRDEREVAANEGGGALGLVLTDSFLCLGSKPIDEIGLALLRGHGHESRLLQCGRRSYRLAGGNGVGKCARHRQRGGRDQRNAVSVSRIRLCILPKHRQECLCHIALPSISISASTAGLMWHRHSCLCW